MQGGAEHSGDCTQRSYPLVLEAESDQLCVRLVWTVEQIVNFIVSYLICMFQDSVPAGSYNDPFLSSVCVPSVEM